MITPVPDITPWVFRIFYFPVDAFLCNTVGIVSIDRACIDKFRNDTFDEFRVTQAESLPVLENISPVTLVGKNAVPLAVFQPDCKLIPWAARVAMASTECDRKVFSYQPFELGVVTLDGVRQQFFESYFLRQGLKKWPVALINCFVEMTDGRFEVL